MASRPEVARRARLLLGGDYHDEFGNVGAVNCPYAYNAFTTTQEEILKSVGFCTEADGAYYDLRIYDTVSGGAPSGLLALGSLAALRRRRK